MSEQRVVVTGLGMITPLGNTVADSWKALKEGKNGIGPITSFDASKFDSRIAGEVKGFDPLAYGMNSKDIRRMDKFSLYAVACAKDAIKDSGWI